MTPLDGFSVLISAAVDSLLIANTLSSFALWPSTFYVYLIPTNYIFILCIYLSTRYSIFVSFTYLSLTSRPYVLTIINCCDLFTNNKFCNMVANSLKSYLLNLLLDGPSGNGISLFLSNLFYFIYVIGVPMGSDTILAISFWPGQLGPLFSSYSSKLSATLQSSLYS